MLRRRSLMAGVVSGWAVGGAVSGVGAARPASRVLGITVDTGITTDTGDLAPVPPEYRRFPEPMACVAATNWVARSIIQGTLEAQAKRDARFGQTRPADDTLPAAARSVAQACSRHFPLATTPPHQWSELFALALQAGNDTEAQAILTQKLARAGQSAVDRAKVLDEAVEVFVAAHPARLAAAEQSMAQLDAMGHEDSLWQWQARAHGALADVASKYDSWPLLERYGHAQFSFDVSWISKKSNVPAWLGAITAIRQMVLGAYVEAPDSVGAVVELFRKELGTTVMLDAFYDLCQDAPGWRDNFPQLCNGLAKDSAAQSAQILSALDVPRYIYTPTAAPPLRADFWFPPPGGPPGDTVRPVAGRVSIVYRWVGGGDCEDIFHFCRKDSNVLQEFLAHYGARVTGTVVVDAAGFTVLHVPASPAEVAKSYQWYFQRFLHLPVAVAVRMRSVREHRPPPDGRIFYSDTTAYHDVYDTHDFVVTDPRNQIVYLSSGGQMDSRTVIMLQHLIARLQAKP